MTKNTVTGGALTIADRVLSGTHEGFSTRIWRTFRKRSVAAPLAARDEVIWMMAMPPFSAVPAIAPKVYAVLSRARVVIELLISRDA